MLTETLTTVPNLSDGTFLESNGLIVMEAEHFGQRLSGTSHDWLLKTSQSGYTGTSYLQPLPDVDALYQTSAITNSPVVSYPIYVTTPGTYTVWLRGYPTNAAGDSVYVGLGEVITDVTGFAPGEWSWANKSATLPVDSSGVYTVSVWMREDGLRIDRLLLTTDTNFIPTSFGPVETERYVTGTAPPTLPLTRTLVYTYDNLYRLTEASYSTGEQYEYAYDPVGNRLQQIIDGDTTDYLYDAANRLEQLNGQQVYTFDANGNLLESDVLTNTFDAANRLVETERAGTVLEPIYNGVGDRVGQVTDGVTTTFALDVQGLPEVIYTSEGNAYLHLPGVIMAESAANEVRYLLSDGLGSVRQAVDDTGAVVAYHEFDPYGNLVQSGDDPYGFTGEWWESEIGLLHLRARWYLPTDGIFLSRDPIQSEPPYAYVRGNVVNRVDPSGYIGCDDVSPFDIELYNELCGGGGRARPIPVPPIIPEIPLPEFPPIGPIPPRPNYPPGGPIPIPAPEPPVYPDTTGTGENPFDLPELDLSPKPTPTPWPKPFPVPRPTPPATCTPTPDDFGYKVLTLGDGNFSYSYSLHGEHPDWKITGTDYGNGSNSQTRIPGSIGNLKLYTHVDGTRLESGPETGRNRYDAIVFNAPRPIRGWYSEGSRLVDDILANEASPQTAEKAEAKAKIV